MLISSSAKTGLLRHGIIHIGAVAAGDNERHFIFSNMKFETVKNASASVFQLLFYVSWK